MIYYSGNKELQIHALLNTLILSLKPNISPGMKLIKDKKVKIPKMRTVEVKSRINNVRPIQDWEKMMIGWP